MKSLHVATVQRELEVQKQDAEELKKFQQERTSVVISSIPDEQQTVTIAAPSIKTSSPRSQIRVSIVPVDSTKKRKKFSSSSKEPKGEKDAKKRRESASPPIPLVDYPESDADI